MTEDKLQWLGATGKEMDALIAEKVMGWRYNSLGDAWIRKNTLALGCEKFQPSTKIEHAWFVVEKLCNETGCDIVKVCKRDPELLRGEWSCNFGRGFEAFADTVALAICRAALQTVIGEL